MNKFISSVILLIVAIGLSFTFTKSNFSKINELDESIGQYAAALEQSKQLNELESSLTQKYQAIPIEDRERIQKFLPQNIDTVRLTIEIDSIASQNQIEIENLTFVENETDDSANNNEFPEVLNESDDSIMIDNSSNDYSFVDMSFNATGTYEELNSFLENLENNLRLTDVQKLSIQSTDEGDLLTYAVTIRTYWLGN